MSSNEKLEANRANAQLSTGPKTVEGKAVSSLNGTTHGLAASRISPRNPEALARYEKRKAAYMARYASAAHDPIETDLIDAMAMARTRQELIEERQSEIEDEASSHYQVLQRYWRDAERAFHRSIQLLESLRAKPSADARRAQAAAADTEARQHARFRFALDAHRFQGALLEQEISLQDKEKAALVASLRQTVGSLASQRLNPDPQPAESA